MKTKTLLCALLLSLVIFSCKKDEVSNNSGSLQTDPPIILPEDCQVQLVVDNNLNPLYSYYYREDYPELLDHYKEYSPTQAGLVLDSYRVIWGVGAGGVMRVDTVYHYQGDLFLYGPGQFFTAKEYFYTNYGSGDVMDSIKVYYYTHIPEEPFGHKGTIYCDYDAGTSGLLIRETYVDNPDYEYGTYLDDTETEYHYDSQGRLTGWYLYNYLGNQTYYEEYIPSNYFQPNFRFTVNQALRGANRYAPLRITNPSFVNGGMTGTTVSNLYYQVNAKNFIVDQALEHPSGDMLLKLITYECVD